MEEYIGEYYRAIKGLQGGLAIAVAQNFIRYICLRLGPLGGYSNGPRARQARLLLEMQSKSASGCGP